MPPRRRRLVPTGVAADEIGVDRSTLAKWARDGYVKPAFVTIGRHARWDVEDLRRQIHEWGDRLPGPADDEAPDQ